MVIGKALKSCHWSLVIGHWEGPGEQLLASLRRLPCNHASMHLCNIKLPNIPSPHLPISPLPQHSITPSFHYSCLEYAEWLAEDSLLSTICRISDTCNCIFLQFMVFNFFTGKSMQKVNREKRSNPQGRKLTRRGREISKQGH
jgi:hypothetical protein